MPMQRTCQKAAAMRNKRAFTLIELLVVISVIALLLAILMPALMLAKEHAKRMVCCNNVRILGMANTLYAEDADGWYVPIMDRTLGENRYWPANQHFRKLVGYKSKQSETDSDWHAPKEFLCPSDVVSNQQRPDAQWDSWISYGYNITDWYFSDWYGIGYAGHKNATVRTPSAELIFTESNDWWLWWWGANYVDGWDVLGQDGITPYKEVGCDGPTLYRHSEGVNIAFYDGHVQHLKKDKVWSQEAWDAGTPGMWSTFSDYPPTPVQQSRLPKP
ncbi:MAG: prepilin-type N-terminal cleavage/methylation domain-containing protein [Phycisphaerales bacterium]|nr:MAG: prepilin-type N-terminal cleavage/methylation domain-containing protein [Phycisphaerales bacterium]